MITLGQYVGIYGNSKDLTRERKSNAIMMLSPVNQLIAYLQTQGVKFLINPKTDTQVSGTVNGGFRPQDCKEGAAGSAHKEGKAVDIYDPMNEIDNYITAHPEVLERFNLYREHPSATLGWCHLTDRAPKSGNRSYMP